MGAIEDERLRELMQPPNGGWLWLLLVGVLFWVLIYNLI